MAGYDAVQRDPLQAGARSVAAAAVLAGATLVHAAVVAAAARCGARRGVALACVTAYSLVAGLAAGELALSCVDRSQAVGYSLAGRLWFTRHWHLDPSGLRERLPDPREVQHHKVVLVAGDSFTAGHGIADLRDTFCARLGDRLGPGYRALNLGVNNTDTMQELGRLREFKGRPHAIVLAYFGNDITSAAFEAGFPPPAPAAYADVPHALRPLVERSYLLNFVYWSVPRRDLDVWWTYLREAYARPDLRARHAAELGEIAAHARFVRAPLTVVLFPYLHDLPGSAVYSSFVKQVFAAEGVPVLDVAPLVEPLSLRERVVNMNDMHPSAEVHRRVGDALHELLVARGLAE